MKEKKITRDNWVKHKYFYSSFAFRLVKIHNHFRDQFDIIYENTVQNRLKEAHRLFSNLKETLDSHHKGEEEKLFPFLEEKLNLKIEGKKLRQGICTSEQ